MTSAFRPLEPLAGLRRELLAILDLLGHEGEHTIRAELANELIRTCSMYLDATSRVVYPALRRTGHDVTQVDRAESSQQTVRGGLTAIRDRMKGVKPADVHSSDSEGFEMDLDELVNSIRDHINYEDQVLFPSLQTWDGPASEELRDEVQQAVDHASTHPDPPKNAVGRAVVAVVEKLNRNVHDQSTVPQSRIDLHAEDPGAACGTE